MASAGNTSSIDGTPSANPRLRSGGIPVAHEEQVIATGARPTENSDKRELFKESTTTALVFPSGGVIRLSAAVAPGQLLFLTNPQTRREVVAQVTRKRNNPATGYYVELEFTEAAPDFWGVEFPENPAEVSTENRQQPAVAQLLQSAESSADDLSPNAPGPSASEVQALIEEVEALRAQLKSMQNRGTAADAVASGANRTTLLPTPMTTASNPAKSPDQSVSFEGEALLARIVAVQPASPVSEARDVADSASGGAVSPEVPTSAKEKLISDEDLLPKPALNFQKAKASKQSSAAGLPRATSADRSGLLRLALLAVVSLFAVTVAAWNMHWLPWASGVTSLPSTGVSPARPAASASSLARPLAEKKSDAHADLSGIAQVPSPLLSPGNGGATVSPANGFTTEASLSTSGKEPASPAKIMTSRASNEEFAPVVSVAKHSAERAAPASKVAPVLEDGVAIVPPRLLKSVRAVAPSDALRGFVTGNVTLDALIDKLGQVKSMKVLSGPASFHKAAMDALKQYRYEPAQQNGRPVSAHVTVTLPFWFEP